MAGDMEVASLQNRLGLSETLAFDSYQRPTRLNLTVPSVQAATYLQGAYMTLWQPACQDQVLFHRRNCEFGPGQPSPGDVPVPRQELLYGSGA